MCQHSVATRDGAGHGYLVWFQHQSPLWKNAVCEAEGRRRRAVGRVSSVWVCLSAGRVGAEARAERSRISVWSRQSGSPRRRPWRRAASLRWRGSLQATRDPHVPSGERGSGLRAPQATRALAPDTAPRGHPARDRRAAPIRTHRGATARAATAPPRYDL